MATVVLCYASPDEPFARSLADFLASNLPLSVSLTDAVIGPDITLTDAVERALSAEIALVLLSPLSVPPAWHRSIWEPLFFSKPKELGTHLAFVLIADCKFPPLLRRGRFFDASQHSLPAFRRVRNWLLRPDELAGASVPVSPESEELRHTVADRPGIVRGIAPERALQFVSECSADFEAVHIFDCRNRSRAGILGDIGHRLGLNLSGRTEHNRAALAAWATGHRVLFVLAGVNDSDCDSLAPGGMTSVIFSLPPNGDFPGCVWSAAAEAVRAFSASLRANNAGSLTLGWSAVGILKGLARFAEVLEVLEAMAEFAQSQGSAQDRSRIAREQYWISDTLDYEGPALAPPSDPESPEQLRLPFAQ